MRKRTKKAWGVAILPTPHETPLGEAGQEVNKKQ